ncbi:hypothetical protein, partial [Photobacterium damselae]|uniref:hypothetical protein n=1 Tax=Photobacterium damselae TaxID=38293 RepID=UPI001A8F235A
RGKTCSRLQPCLLKIYSNMVVLWGNYEGIPQGWTSENALTARLVKELYESHDEIPGRRFEWHGNIWTWKLDDSWWEGWIRGIEKSDIIAPTCMYKDIYVNPSESTKKRFKNYKQMVRNVVLVK